MVVDGMNRFLHFLYTISYYFNLENASCETQAEIYYQVVDERRIQVWTGARRIRSGMAAPPQKGQGMTYG